MRRKYDVMCVVLLVFCMGFHLANGDDWPRWRGPMGNGISKEKNWDPEALKRGPKIKWEANVGKGHSAVSIQDGRLLTMGNRAIPTTDDTTYEDIVFCLDARSGREMWRYTHQCQPGGDFSGPLSTPAIYDGAVYSICRDTECLCLDLETGMVNWARNLAADSLTQGHQWGYSASPVIEGELLILNAGESGLVLNRFTGEVIWKSNLVINGFGSPVVFSEDNRRLAAMQADKALYFVDILTGEKVWSYPWISLNDPIILDRRIFLTAGRDGKEKGIMLVDRREDSDEIIWQQKRQDVSFQNWVVFGDYGYGQFRNRRQDLRCVRLSDGQIMWREDFGMWGSLTAADEKLILVTGEGELIIAHASPDSFQVISRARVMSIPDPGKTPPIHQCYLWTHPVLSNGFIYIRNTYGNLVCVDMHK